MATDGAIPYAVQAALIDAVGKVFWYWDPYRHFLKKAGVPIAVVERMSRSGLSKYAVMREVLGELDGAGKAGREVQIKLVRDLLAIRIGNAHELDPEVAKAAQAALRSAATEAGLVQPPKAKQRADAERSAAHQRRLQAEKLRRERVAAEARRRALYEEYCALLAPGTDRQARGYRLEEILGELAEIDGVRYAPPYRKSNVNQTDGMLTYEGFQYLVEIRWRVDLPNVNEVAALGAKASRNLQSTRALFLSVDGFRAEVVTELETGAKNVLLMTGHELAVVLGGDLSLGDVLRLKVEEGAKKGHILYDVVGHAA